MLKEKLLEICNLNLKQKGLEDAIYKKRLNEEMVEIDAQNEHAYFLNLHEQKAKFPENENNLLVPYLLDLVEEVDINLFPKYTYGDFPDADIDFLMPELRTHIKDVWAPATFGKDKVCNIGSYNTFGIKNSLIDIVRVLGKSRQEILDLTTKMGLKDEDGKGLTWDKALEMYPDLKTYCDNNPDVAEAAEKFIGRTKGQGKHAGGLIISSVPIDEFVPLIKDKDGNPLSSWVEGLSGQELGPVGLVKYDVLGLVNLLQIAIGCKLVKERHGLSSICALPGQKDWSDTSYLNDPDSLAMANKGDLRCIFQFDSDGIRNLVKSGGAASFEDMVAYNALFRPGCMQMKMHTEYAERKKGKKEYKIHPLLQPILGKTYGVITFQEQCIKMLNVVGNIPLKDCELLRKAISKKNEEYFASYKKMFVENGQKNLEMTEEEVEYIWNQIAAFSGYAFNRSHSVSYCFISMRLLWLKTHYPIEFFTAMLSCEDKYEKIKEYKMEALRCGIELVPIDINKCKVNFDIIDNKIYYGLSKIKGIGEEVAKRIVENQPYQDFDDFLNRFGTDGTVIKPLLGLRVFGDDPVEKYKYYQWFKDIKSKKNSSQKRYEDTLAEKIDSLKSLLPESLHRLANYNSECFQEIKDIIDFRSGKPPKIEDWPEGENVDLDESLMWQDEDGMCYYLFDDIEYLFDKYFKWIESRNKRSEKVEESKPFNADDIDIDVKLLDAYSTIEKSQNAFYGFLWTHPLEKSVDYLGDMTFESYRGNELLVGQVELQVLSVEQKEGKSKKKTKYWLLKVEDANSEENLVQVWEEDYDRFKEELVVGAMLRLRLSAPSGGFSRYTLESPPKYKRHMLPKDKMNDYRVITLK